MPTARAAVRVAVLFAALVLRQGTGHAQPTQTNGQEQNRTPETKASVPKNQSVTTASPAAGSERTPDTVSRAADKALLEAAIDSDEVIVVKGSSAPRTASATSRDIGQEAVTLAPKRSTDDLLRLVPGLFISQHASEGKAQQFFLRGFDAVHGSDLELKVAGVPVNEMSNVHGHGYAELAFVPPEVVRGLSATKGSFDLRQGNFATAGSIGLSLGVDPALRGTRVGYEAGTTNRHRVFGLWAPAGEPDENFVAVDSLVDQGFGENRGATRLSALAQRRLHLTSDSSLEALVVGYAARFGEPGTTPLADVERGTLGFYDAYDEESSGASQRAQATVTYRHESNSQRVKVIGHAGWRRLRIEENNTGFLVSEEFGDRKRQRQRTMITSVRSEYERDVGPVTILGGGLLHFEDLTQTDNQIDSAGDMWRANRSVTGQQMANALYLGARAGLGDIALTGGGRLDLFWFDASDRLTEMRGSGVRAQLSPRLSAAWAPNDTLRLFAGVGRGVRSPELRAFLTSPDGDAPAAREVRFEPDVTTTDAAEMSAAVSLGNRATVGLGVFGVRIENEMVFDHLSGRTLARNATRRLGAEANAQLSPMPWLTLRADASFVDARFRDSRDPVPGVPNFLASLEARAGRAAGARLGLVGRYLGPRPLAHGARGESQVVVNGLTGYRWHWLDLQVQVDNVLGTRWREGEYHYASWFDTSQPRSELPRLHFAPGRPFGVRASLTAWF